MYGEYDVQTTDGVIHVLQNLNNRTAYLESMINGQNINAMLQYLSDSRRIEIYSHQVHLYVQAMRERYLRTPENLIYELRLLLEKHCNTQQRLPSTTIIQSHRLGEN